MDAEDRAWFAQQPRLQSWPEQQEPFGTGRIRSTPRRIRQPTISRWRRSRRRHLPRLRPAELDDAAEIQKYAALKGQGLITEEEFEAKKKQILGI